MVKGGEKLDHTYKKGEKKLKQLSIGVSVYFISQDKGSVKYLKVDGMDPVNRKMEEEWCSCGVKMMYIQDTSN